MTRFPCPYLHDAVELTAERRQHIGERHPDLLPEHEEKLVATLANPDTIRCSGRFANARLFSRWYNDLRQGKYVVAVVVSDATVPPRHWIVTAYLASSLSAGEVEWEAH